MVSPVRIKICGITNLSDAMLAANQGAWALGFIFFQKSPRYVKPNLVRKIVDSIHNLQQRPFFLVGVFVNSSLQDVLAYAHLSGINAVQLHGDEDGDFVNAVKKQSQLSVIKAFRPSYREDLVGMDQYKSADLFLCDAAVKGSYGGTGQLSHWDLAIAMANRKPTILAGGLNASNILHAVSSTGLHAYDLSSGVEKAPGIKDEPKVKALFDQLGRVIEA